MTKSKSHPRAIPPSTWNGDTIYLVTFRLVEADVEAFGAGIVPGWLQAQFQEMRDAGLKATLAIPERPAADRAADLPDAGVLPVVREAQRSRRSRGVSVVSDRESDASRDLAVSET